MKYVLIEYKNGDMFKATADLIAHAFAFQLSFDDYEHYTDDYGYVDMRELHRKYREKSNMVLEDDNELIWAAEHCDWSLIVNQLDFIGQTQRGDHSYYTHNSATYTILVENTRLITRGTPE